MESLIENVEIIRYDNGRAVTKVDPVLKESRLLIDINGVSSHHLICTKSSLQSFIVGYLFSEALIHDYSDIQEIRLNETHALAYVRISNSESLSESVSDESTDCTKQGFSSRAAAVMDFLSVYPKLDSRFKVSAERVLESVSDFSKTSELFISTGSVHSCALCDASKTLCFNEDISRHNALDKIIGYALINQIELGNCYVITSGRVPSDMISKIIRAGIPMVVSRSAPTDSAILLAQKYGVTLVGFARGKRMNIYSSKDRVITENDL